MEQARIEESNFQLFREILSSLLVQKFTTSSSSSKQKVKTRRAKAGRKTTIKPVSRDVNPDEEERNNAEDLSDFIDYLASEIFKSLPDTLRSLTYSIYISSSSHQDSYDSALTPARAASILNALPAAIAETLETYELLAPSQTVSEFLTPVLSSYIDVLTRAPPPPSQTKEDADGCEICERDWIPLTYHHLIPRSVHAKVLKRGWWPEDQLQNVAWLCRACHSFVHRVAGAEELAREFYTVERLVGREDVRAFAKWVGGVRWKSQ